MVGMLPLPGMPSVSPKVLPLYQELLLDRLGRFPQIEEDEILVSEAEAFDPTSEHLLRYDAESVFWAMLWWLLQAMPEGTTKDDPKSILDLKIWLNLTDHKEDARYEYFVLGSKPFPFHPAYDQISRLLEEMRNHLRIDLSSSKISVKKEEPEYLCEVFQRLVLNFLVEHKDSAFLDERKDANWRRIPEPALGRNKSGRQKNSKSQKSAHRSSTPGAGLAGRAKIERAVEAAAKKVKPAI